MQNADIFHEMISDWLLDGDTVIASGDWKNGSIIELIPHGRAEILGEAGNDSGLRRIRLKESDHHIHLDLNRIRCARYIVTPSICLQFRPSFEMHLISDTDETMVAFMIRNPYMRGELDETAISRYIARAEKHQLAHPQLVELHLKETSKKVAYEAQNSPVSPSL